MANCIALLRGINVSGHNKVSMDGLRAFASDLGLEEPKTLLQSGNLVFRGPEQKTPTTLEKLLETEFARRLNQKIDFLVRNADEWAEIVSGNPFRELAESDPSHLVVVFLKGAPDVDAVKALRAAVRGPEVIFVEGRQAYITYPAGIGDSKLTNVIIEKKLGTRGTGRNWNTVLKLGAMLV